MHAKRKGGEHEHPHTLVIPLDASDVEGFEPEQEVKVVARDRDGALYAQSVRLDKNGQGRATLRFPAAPGALHVAVGPGSASDDELLGLQTIRFDLPSRRWQNEPELQLPPVRITPYYWYWWLRWCRTFTIRGRVVCPDGSAVPGATVCAFDIDRWFIWTSKQQVGCATTDIDGAFSITFRWCCGWWPWWWWRFRVWELDPRLIERVRPVLQRVPDLRLGPTGHQPSLKVFEPVLQTEGRAGLHRLQAADVDALPNLRNELLNVLPSAPDLAQLGIWPWAPWHPWWDCAPDLVFRITQTCDGEATVLLDEGIGDTRWNASSPLETTLVVESACCRPGCQNPPCEEGECIVVDQVCSVPIDEIGGNLGADPAPAGYAYPGPVLPGTSGAHRPFGGTVPIYKNPGDLINVDYYEIEVDDGSGWQPLETVFPGAALDFERRYWDTTALSIQPAAFPVVDIAGRRVTETREHYEANSGLTWDTPGADAWWLSTNWNLLIPLDSTKIAPDGTYGFRIVGWDLDGGGNLVNRRVLPICGTDDENELVLTLDNRVIDDLSHDPTHNCGGVHVCTTEPDTHISDVRINGVSVGPCDTVDATTGTLEIDFLVSDPDGHLGHYSLHSTWGLNNSRNLLNRPGVSVTPLAGGTQSGWMNGQTTGNYGTALAQGATAPAWTGGLFTLSMPVAEAFPEPCCYQLELVAVKRTIVGHRSGASFACSSVHRNDTEYTLGVGVCGRDEVPPVLEAREDAVARRPANPAVR